VTSETLIVLIDTDDPVLGTDSTLWTWDLGDVGDQVDERHGWTL